MDAFLIVGIAEALLIIALILSKKQKGLWDYSLAAYFVLFSINILLSYLEIRNRANGYPIPFIIHTSTPVIFLHGPTLWLYIKSLTAQKFQFKPKYLLHLIPFLAITTLFYFEIYSHPYSQRIAIDSSGGFKNHISYPITLAAVALVSQGYFVWGLLLLRRYNRRIKGFFSSVEHIDLAWLRFLLLSAIVCYALISTLYISDYIMGLLPFNFMQLIGFVLASAYVLLLGFYGLKQGNVFVSGNINIDLDKASTLQVVSTPLEKGEEDFVKRLMSHMKEKKPHCNTELTLTKLSDELAVTPDYLSGILNGRLNMNFFDFVNHYRIEEFKKQCCNPQNSNLTLVSIAYDCGFNSKATFNRVFKKATGITPSEFTKQSQLNETSKKE
ncbi:MAG: helix-turn-helix transcriptional regulator [Bacteroidales bacterium]|nr:helix-turn-helix transcriptional regulator [Bacteroidales bacterium]